MDELKNKKEKVKYTSIGGQALIEGIMMRGPKLVASVIRKTDNTFAQKIEPVKPVSPILKVPFIRGVYSFIMSMVIGIQAINYSASFFEDEEDPDYEPSKFEKFLEEKLGDKLGGVLIAISMVLGLALSVGLFVILPTFLVGLFGDLLPTALKNLFEGIVRLAIFIAYIWAVSKMPDIKRVFMYHGAEHKTIACYEHKEKPTVENVRKHTRFHPRCGTSFLLIVMVISIIVFSFLKWDDLLQRSVCRILLMPVVMAISYEIIKLAGKYDNVATRIISAPGLWLQRLTTREPTDSMIEVAIRALNLVREDLTDEEKDELEIMPEPKKSKKAAEDNEKLDDNADEAATDDANCTENRTDEDVNSINEDESCDGETDKEKGDGVDC